MSSLGTLGVNQTAAVVGLGSLSLVNRSPGSAPPDQNVTSTSPPPANFTTFVGSSSEHNSTSFTANSTQTQSSNITSTISTQINSTQTISSNTTSSTNSSTSLTASGTPLITLSSQSGSAGTPVQISGTSFSASDSTCTLTDDGVGQNETCSISDEIVTASFVVADVSAGSYTITVTGSPSGDGASQAFNVTSSLSISLNETSTHVGVPIQVSGTGFSSSDSNCTLSGDVVSLPSCSLSSGELSGSFVVANVTTGSYTIIATGSPSGDSTSINFTVTQNNSNASTHLYSQPNVQNQYPENAAAGQKIVVNTTVTSSFCAFACVTDYNVVIVRILLPNSSVILSTAPASPAAINTVTAPATGGPWSLIVQVLWLDDTDGGITAIYQTTITINIHGPPGPIGPPKISEAIHSIHH